ncbi:MAG: anti-sigma factor [Novosphingobium sp.]
MNRDRDERLAAWLDGVMPADEVAEFEAELASDPELALRAQRWKANDARIAGAFAPIAGQELDSALLEAMGLGEPASLPAAANDNPPWWRRHALPLGGAIAASLLCVVLLTQYRKPVQSDAFQVALETTPSRGEARLADGRVLRPSLTVRAKDGRYCREYSVAGDIGLACRKEGKWSVEAEGKGDGPANGSDIGLAAGADGSALDQAYSRIGASDPLDEKAEADLIAKGW